MKITKILNKELKNVNGGAVGDMISTTCHNCGEYYSKENAKDFRVIGDGCDEYSEIQCPKCGTWNKEIIN